MINSTQYIHSQPDADQAERDIEIIDSLIYHLNTTGCFITLTFTNNSLALHVGRKARHTILKPRDMREALNIVRGIYLTVKES